MNALSEPFKQLVERKLWPIALLLVAALVAVPLLLTKKEAASDALPLATTAAPAGAGSTDSIVSLSDAGKTDSLRAVLGDRKDPFRPAQLHRVKKAQDTLTNDAGSATSVDSGGGASGGGGGGGGDVTTTPSVDVTPTPTPVAPTYELYSLEVRFGSTDGELVTRNVKRLTGLPGGTNPAALYLGLLSDHKSAVFILDAGVEALGDGHCEPSPENCQTLTLRKGETEFLTRGEKQWELDLVDIHVQKTTNADIAAKARTAEAKGGRKVLKGLISRVGSYRYDSTKGALHKVARPKRPTAKTAATFTSSG